MLGEESDVSDDESEHSSTESCESEREDGNSLTPNAIDNTTAVIAILWWPRLAIHLKTQTERPWNNSLLHLQVVEVNLEMIKA